MTIKILHGDCIEQMKTMDDESVDCVVTSPPYWGLRDYGVDGQIGLEATLDEHLEKMVEVFEEIKRILKPTGTVFLNYGDCYASTPNGRKAKDVENDDRCFRDKPMSTVGGVLKPKDLCMIPNRLAIALQCAGWWVRSEIIWAKPNPMPESVTDRPAQSHEKIFLLTKSPRYFYDAEAVRKPAADASIKRWDQDIENQTGSTRANGGKKTNGNMKAVGGRTREVPPRNKGYKNHTTLNEVPTGHGRNLRNYEPAPVQVWEFATRPFKEAHFATFPPELAERCIKAGCPQGGVVFDPFGGAGTTGLVADRLGLDAVLIELNDDYIDIASKRIVDDNPMFAEVVA